MVTRKEVGIIGGGITGLVAAYRLSQKGYKVTVLEKSMDLGGLAGGFKLGGESIEKAYHHIFQTDKDIIKLTDELGLADKLEWKKGSIGMFVNSKLWPFMTPKDLLNFSPLGFFDKLRLGLIKILLENDKGWEKYVGVRAGSWMRKWGGEKNYRIVWEPLLRGKFHHYHENVSMAWLWARIHTRGNSKAKGETEEKLGYYRGGFQVLVDELAKRIKENKGDIITGVAVQKISRRNDKKLVVEWKEKNKYDCKNVFDSVVAAVPSDVLASFLKGESELDGEVLEFTRMLRSIDYLGSIVVVFSTNQSLSRLYWHNVNDVNSPFLAFIQHTNLIGNERYGGKHVYYMGNYLPHDHRYFGESDEKIYKEFFGYLKKLFPQFEPSKVLEKYLFRLNRSQHVVDTNYINRIPGYKTPIDGLFLANFSQIFPEDRGTNFAVREGEKVAKMI